MPTIVPIVEGGGEVEAFPILLRNLLADLGRYDIQVCKPKNAKGRHNLTKPGGIESFAEIAWMERDCVGVIVLADADEDCPVTLANDLCARIRTIGVRKPTSVVLAKCEYEAWFLASLPTIPGKCDIPESATHARDVELRRDVKGWLTAQMSPHAAYKETVDQSRMTARIDLAIAHANSRSFRRLRHAVEELIAAARTETIITTPGT